MNSTRRSAFAAPAGLRLTRQRVEDRAVEDEAAPDLARGAQRVVQRGVVVGAQVAAQPDQRAIQGFVHGLECAAE